jgi:hypothetical protein
MSEVMVLAWFKTCARPWTTVALIQQLNPTRTRRERCSMIIEIYNPTIVRLFRPVKIQRLICDGCLQRDTLPA